MYTQCSGKLVLTTYLAYEIVAYAPATLGSTSPASALGPGYQTT